MLGTQHAALDLQALALERLSLPVLALHIVVDRLIVHGRQRVGMLRTPDNTPYRSPVSEAP
jgi:hypothetical protein